MARKLKTIIVPDEQGNPVRYEVEGADASSATAGQAPIADGQGGWQWGDVETGDSVPTEVRQAILALFQNGVYTSDGMSDEVAVVASWASEVTSISVSPTTLNINGMNQRTIVATTQPAGGIVSWSSSDESIATVSNGVVTPTGVNGSCTVTASCGGKSATCAVTVSGFATLVSISAVYTQSGTVYDTDTLDSLKSDLVVTANWSDGRSTTVTDYTLQGTLEVGTSTIVVAYGDKTATFSVAVSERPTFPILNVVNGNITTGSTNTTIASVVWDTITFAESEVKTITAKEGYTILPFTLYGVNNKSQAGTGGNSANYIYAYVVTSSGYTNIGNEASNRIAVDCENNPTGGPNFSTWATYTNTADSVTVNVTGAGIIVKRTDGANISTAEAVNAYILS